MATFWLRNARRFDAASGPAVDVRIEDAHITAIVPHAPAQPIPAGVTVQDVQGALLLPGLVEAHTHLDKTLWGMDWYVNDVGPALQDRIDNERAFRARSGHDAATQSLALARAFLRRGTTRIRSHVDVDTEAGLKHLHGVHRTRDALRGEVEIQTVAFPQSGLLVRPGTDELLDAALRAGADGLGGLDPHGIDRDAVASLDLLFGLADRHGKPVDIHLHEPGAMGARSLDLILDRTQALGLQGRVLVSHAFCLGDVDDARRAGLLDRMARLQVAVATTGTPSRPVPPLLECRAAGVTVAAGNDGIRDTWTPYGSPDMLERAMLIGLRNNLRRDDDIALAFDTVSAAGARACGFAGHGLAVGCRADLVVVRAQTLAHAVVDHPVPLCVVSHGRLAAREGATDPATLPPLERMKARSSAG